MEISDQQKERILKSKFAQNLQNGVLETDNSEFIQWDGCMVSGINYGVHRRANVYGRSPLVFGDCVHVGLEAFFRGDKDWLKQSLDRAQEVDLDSLHDPRRNTLKLESLLRSYAREYSLRHDMQFEIVTMDGQATVEQGFTVPLGEIEINTVYFGSGKIQIFWLGKMDLFTLYEQKLAPVDHKTTTVMGEKYIDTFLRSSQMLGYTYFGRAVAKRLFGDQYPVFGCRINALAMRSNGFEFRVFDLPCADWKIAEWQRETLEAIRRRIQELDRVLQTGIASPTREHCVTKYGRCSYFDACDLAPNMRDRMLFDDSFFYVSNWSPLL